MGNISQQRATCKLFELQTSDQPTKREGAREICFEIFNIFNPHR